MRRPMSPPIFRRSADPTGLEWFVAMLGVILFVAPWLFGFTAVAATSWVSWLAGLAVVGVSMIALLGEKPRRMATT